MDIRSISEMGQITVGTTPVDFPAHVSGRVWLVPLADNADAIWLVKGGVAGLGIPNSGIYLNVGSFAGLQLAAGAADQVLTWAIV